LQALQVREFQSSFALGSAILVFVSALAPLGISQGLLGTSHVLLGPFSALFHAANSPGLAEIQGQNQTGELPLTAGAAAHRILKQQ
jgi:hypothetical protein